MATKSKKVTLANPKRTTGTSQVQGVRQSTRGEKGAEAKSQGEQPAVPLETHYAVFKDVESRVKDRLAELEHPYYFTGLRVAYDLKDSMHEPYELPYTFEFGDLALLDLYMKCGEQQELSEDDLRRITKNAPIPYDFLKALFEDARAELHGAASQEIRVGVFIVLNGSNQKASGMLCGCQADKRYTTVPNGSSQAQTCGSICPPPSPPRTASRTRRGR